MRRQTFLRAVRDRYIPHLQHEYHQTPVLSYPHYTPCNEKIAAFHETRRKIRAIFGANRAGKTTAGAYELLTLARQHAGAIFWAGALSYDFARVCYNKILEHVAPEEIIHTSWIRLREKVPSMIQLNNSSTIYFKSYDSGPDKFQAEGVKGIWLDEEPPEMIFSECLARTIDTEGFLWLTMTPLKGRNWVYKRIYKANNPHIKHWTVTLHENKFIKPEEIEIAESIYTQDERDSRLEGKFTILQGGVFKEFNPDRHIVEPFKIPAEWPHSIALDLGWHHPFAVLFGAISPDGILWIYEGYKESERLLEEHYHRITAIADDLDLYTSFSAAAPFYRWEVAISDHEAQTRAELEALGLYTIPANKEVDFGVALLNRLFKHDRVRIFNTLPELQEEIDGLVYKPISDKSDDKEVILKKDDHLTDALRYLAVYYFGETDFALRSTEVVTGSSVL